MDRSATATALPCVGPTSLAWVVVLEATEHPHLARATDAWHDAAGGLRVQVDVPGGVPLDEWAAARGPLEPGEAVTVLLPVLAVVEHLRHRGVPVTGVGTGGVLVDTRGAPVLVRAELGGAAGQEARSDVAGLVAFVAAVLGRVRWPHGQDPPSVELEGATERVEVVELVHDLAEPLPLATPDPGRCDVATKDPDPQEEPAPPAWTALLPESAVVERALAWWARGGPRAAVASLRAVRPRFWVTAGAVGGALVASAVVLGGGGPAGTAAPAGTTVTPRAVGEPPVAPPAGGPLAPPTEPDRRDAAVGADAGEAVAGEAVAGDGPGGAAGSLVTGDDPGEAAAVLLAARQECLHELDEACLLEVDDAASPLLGHDLAFVRAPAGERPEPGVCVDLVETARWGGSALLRCERAGTTAASVLVVRTEAGWRLREIAPAGEGP